MRLSLHCLQLPVFSCLRLSSHCQTRCSAVVVAVLTVLLPPQAAMEAGRRLREEQYAALKDKEWEDTLRREGELHRWAVVSLLLGCQRACAESLTVVAAA